MPFMTIPEAAILWHISVSELRELCENHMISGAVDFYGQEQRISADFLAAATHLNKEKRSLHHDSI